MRRHRADLVIAVLSVVLMMVGLIVMYAIGPAWANFMNMAYGSEYGREYFFVHQLVSVVLSVGVFVVAYRVPFSVARRMARVVLVGALVSCVVLAVAGWMESGLASCTLGACRWIDFGGVSFQPAELLKLGVVMYVAVLLGERKREGKLDTRETMIPLAVVMGVATIFVAVVQKDLGTMVTMVAAVGAMMWVGGVRGRILAVMGGVLVVACALLIVLFPHRMERIAGGDSYHQENALLAIGVGGFWGVGVGNSVQATGYLPESINDSVFAVMGETFGFVGLVVIIGCFVVLLMRLLRVAERLRDETGRVMVAGVFGWVASHVIINMAGMTGLAPIKGITLPLLSYGGTSMVFVAAALGLALQLSRYTGREVEDEGISGRRGERGTRYAGAGRNR